MRYLTDEDVAALVPREAAIDAVERAFASCAAGRAAVQERVRTGTEGTKLSTLGATLADEKLLGAKVYATTPSGRFRFVILLFSDDGQQVAILEGRALTALRTAATSVVAARRLARRGAERLVVFGAGQQSLAHAEAFADAFPLQHVSVVHRRDASSFVERLRSRIAIPVQATDDVDAAVERADLIVTATRATAPLFDGRRVRPGAHVTAIGATRPDVRELDDATIGRADAVVVELRPQARREAGDLIQAAASGAFDWERAIELASVVSGEVAGRSHDDQITVFESVGVGLEDVAVAAVAWRAAEAAGVGRDITARADAVQRT